MRILIADDEPINLRVLEAFLVKWGYEIVIAHDGAEAWNVLNQNDAPRLLILDWMMPGLDGVEICRKLRERENQAYFYILLLTARFQKKDIVDGFNAGADDYITKPFEATELRARVRAGARIVELHEKLAAAQQLLEYQAHHDALTKLWNRAAITDLLRMELSRAERTGGSIGLIMADVDHFKKINDQMGHLAGDGVLEEVARRIQSCARAYDAVGRYGGEEFLAILPGAEVSAAWKVAERMRSALADEPIVTKFGSWPTTLSLGLAVHAASSPVQMNDLIQAADVACYRAKHGGRNRIESAAGTPSETIHSQ